MKLLLEHLVGYLPYNLQVNCQKFSDHPEDRQVRALVPQDVWDYNSPTVGLYALLSYTGVYKPLLRSMSDLIKPITVDGKTFIPLVELNRVRGIESDGGEPMLKILGPVKGDTIHTTTEYCLYYDNGFQVFSYELETQSFIHTDLNLKRQNVKPQLPMFEKLYEWHFDLHGLLSAGLALPLVS